VNYVRNISRFYIHYLCNFNGVSGFVAGSSFDSSDVATNRRILSEYFQKQAEAEHPPYNEASGTNSYM
jgi:hypothetical protein